MTEKLYKKIEESLRANRGEYSESLEHSRYKINNPKGKRILVDNAPYIFTCGQNDKLVLLENHSVAIENGVIIEVMPAKKIKRKEFDVIYDAGKRGGVVITPGLINAHAHIHMYLLRSAMMLDEEESLEETIAAMAEWQKNDTDDACAFAAAGDLTEQQKNGITTTLTQGPTFAAAEAAARASRHNLVNAVSAVSNSRPSNNPQIVEKLLKQKEKFYSTPAVAVHYLYKTPVKTLKKIADLTKKYNALLTFHMAESPAVVEQTLRTHRMREVELLEKTGLLNRHSIASHAMHITQGEIEKIVKNEMGVAHLPTSNTIHKSGKFPFWKIAEAGGTPYVSLGTDSVVSKNRLDILTEAYQARITHLYDKTIKFGTLFKMMTVNGARVLNMPDRGKIIPGMKADIVFWKLRDRGFIPYDKKNPMTLLGNLITHGGRSVRDLMINGKFIIKNRRHQYVNESKLLEILQKEHMLMRKRSKKAK